MFTALLGYAVLAGLIYWGVTGAWELLKFACRAAVWVIGAIFTVIGALMDYISDTLKDLPEEYEPTAVNMVKADPFLKFIEYAEETGTVEVGAPLEIKRRLKTAAQNDEVIIASTIKNSRGEEGSTNMRFVKAKDYEKEIKRPLDTGSVFVKPIKMTN